MPLVSELSGSKLQTNKNEKVSIKACLFDPKNRMETNMKNSFTRRVSALALAVLMALSFYSCGNDPADLPDDTDSDTTPQTTETQAPETEEIPVVVVPDLINPLTGLECDKDFSTSRPVAVMLNNIRQAIPQHSVSQCDILYECLAEGGITRLMGVFADYESLGVVGSIRSSRHYYIDLAQNHDALYVHAGASTYAYNEIRERKIDNFDGVNMYLPGMFYRDQDRLQTMSLEHTLMTTGENIKNGIAFKKYRTELKEGYSGKTAYAFAPYGETVVLEGQESKCIYLPYSTYQQARFDYNEENGKYYRFQWEDKEHLPHVDGNNGEQICFDNIFIVFCPTARIPGDTYGRLDVTTEGSGTGFYITGGKYVPITWEKPTADSAITYYGADGQPLMVNRGKTFVSIFPTNNKDNVNLNYAPAN